jgi:indolepyruvate ferredoxin oxidoreductase
VLAYARANSVNWAEFGAPGDRLGLVTAGKSYADLRQALMDLGLDEPALRALACGCWRGSSPLDGDAVRAFARTDEVVRSRRSAARGKEEALAGPAVSGPGKADESGAPLFLIQGVAPTRPRSG